MFKLWATVLCAAASTCVLVHIFQTVSATEVTASSHFFDNSLGFDVLLPILSCHAKYTGYQQVFWYKDFVLLKNGSAGLPDHLLSLSTLLDNSSSSPIRFNNPLNLQGYYWCETDYVTGSSTPALKYLFRMKGIHTFVGKLVASKDSLGDYNGLTHREKISIKKKIYEREMQDIFFGFLLKPNTHVTRINVVGTGLEVHFFLYVQQPLSPRMPYPNKLIEDRHHLEFVEDYLNNETDTYNGYSDRLNWWTNIRGIKLKDITLRSTAGCYSQPSLIPDAPPREINWPYAEIGEIVVPEEACSAKSGLAVTRMCLGSFSSGALWGAQSGKCDQEPNELTTQLRDLYHGYGDESASKFVENAVMELLSRDPQWLTVVDIHYALNILKELSTVSALYHYDINGMFLVMDNLLESNATTIDAAKLTIRLTNRILRIINNVVTQASDENNEVQISKTHLIIDTKSTKAGEEHILGAAIFKPLVETGLQTNSVEFMINGTRRPLHRESVAYFLLPSDLILKRESDLASPCLTKLVYFSDWLLFPNPRNVLPRRNYRVLPTPVMYVSLSGGPAWNLSEPVQIFFKNTYEEKVENPVCVHYDHRLQDEEGGWSREGCQYAGLVDGFHSCHCHHLSIFAVVLSRRPGYRTSKFKMRPSLYAACGVSILALSFAVLLYLLSKIWRCTIDHDILFWLALSFLCCLIIMFISEIHFKWKPGCLVLAMLFHYTVLVTFSWLFMQSVLHQLRFAKKADVAEIPGFLVKCGLTAWGVPGIVIAIIWVSKRYKYYNQDNCYPSVLEVSEMAFIPVVILLLLTMGLNVSAAYAVTCRFKKDFLIGESKYNEGALKFRIALSIYILFVLTWIFGDLALHREGEVFQILFSITITVTAFYVALFFIFHEISISELFGKCKRTKQAPPPTTNVEAVKYEAKSSYKATEESKDA